MKHYLIYFTAINGMQRIEGDMEFQINTEVVPVSEIRNQIKERVLQKQGIDVQPIIHNIMSLD